MSWWKCAGSLSPGPAAIPNLANRSGCATGSASVPAQTAGELVNDATLAGQAGQAGLGHLRGVIRHVRDHVAHRAQLRVDPLP
jgi:hypothetical protein